MEEYSNSTHYVADEAINIGSNLNCNILSSARKEGALTCETCLLEIQELVRGSGEILEKEDETNQGQIDKNGTSELQSGRTPINSDSMVADKNFSKG